MLAPKPCSSGRCRRTTAASLCLLALTFAGHSLAEDTPDELAHRHFDSGQAYFKVSDYDNALREFTAAYNLSKRPELLLSIATVHERMANVRGAIVALEQYLSVAPKGTDRDTVELRVANLRRRLENEAPASTPSAAQSAAPAPVPTSASPSQTPPPEPRPVAAAAPTSPPVAPSRTNWPALVALGVGGLSAIGAVVTGIVAKSEYDSKDKSCSPHCTDEELSGARTMAWTSTALTGVAVVGVGVGVTLLLTGSGSAQAAPTAGLDNVLVGVNPSGITAGAGWRF